MITDCGLYLTVSSDGKIKRDLTAIYGKVSLDDITVEDEIITFSELNFGPYAAVVDVIIASAKELPVGGHVDTVNMNEFKFMMDTLDDLVVTLEQESPLYGTLTRTTIKDCIPADDGSGLFIYNASRDTISILTSVMYLQFEINNILSDLRQGIPIDFESKYNYLREVEVTQILELGDGLTSRYYFRSLSDYYFFLLIHFISSKPTVALCECCGRYFIPKTKRKTLYCDRELKDGKTCKELAPILKHKLTVQSKPVIEEFDRAKRRMYKRYERTKDFGEKPGNRNLSYGEYYDWLARATNARDQYLAGNMSAGNALQIIQSE